MASLEAAGIKEVHAFVDAVVCAMGVSVEDNLCVVSMRLVDRPLKIQLHPQAVAMEDEEAHPQRLEHALSRRPKGGVAVSRHGDEGVLRRGSDRETAGLRDPRVVQISTAIATVDPVRDLGLPAEDLTYKGDVSVRITHDADGEHVPAHHTPRERPFWRWSGEVTTTSSHISDSRETTRSPMRSSRVSEKRRVSEAWYRAGR